MPGIFLQCVLIALVGYLWGSVPAGYWMGKLLRGRDFDIREHGSQKIGATNVLRVLGKWPALIVLIFDLSKGLLPTFLALSLPALFLGGWGPVIAGLAALLGHCLPIFIGFKGGRGVLAGAGALILLSPLTFILAGITAFSTIGIWRYVSLGSLVGAATTMICGIIWYIVGLNNPHFFAAVNLPTMLYLLIDPGLVVLFHHDNIRRLLSGNERKLGQKASSADEPTSVQV